MAENTKKSSAGMILLAWLIVGVPLGWGVYNTLLNSMKLFPGGPGIYEDEMILQENGAHR